MRIELIQLPEDKFRLDQVVYSQLLLKLLQCRDIKEFMQAVTSLTHEQQLQVGTELSQLHNQLEVRVRGTLLNKFDEALENPVGGEKEIVQFLRVMKRLLESCLDKTFSSYDRLMAMADKHPSLQVFYETVEIMVMRLKAVGFHMEGKTKSQVASEMAEIIKRADRHRSVMEVEGEEGRFGQLSEEDKIRLGLFCRLHLFMLNSAKYPVRDQDIRPYIRMLKEKPYLWLLNLLQCIKSEQMSFVYRDILDSKISITPDFHLETNERYIDKSIVNAQALEIAVDRQKSVLTEKAHLPDSILETEDTLYFKFNLMIYKMYEQCVDAADNGEIMAVNEEVQMQFNNILQFHQRVLSQFHKKFMILTTEGSRFMTEHQKLSLLDFNLKALKNILYRYNLREMSKKIVQGKILTIGLTLIDKLLTEKSQPKQTWIIFKRLLTLYRVLLEMSIGNLSLMAETPIPELLIKIIDTHQLPRDQSIINDIFQLVVMYLDPVVAKSNKPVNKLSPNFTRRMLDAYFESESTIFIEGLMDEQNFLQHYLKKDKSPNIQAVFNEFIIEKLKVFQLPDNSVDKLMQNPRRRVEVVKQINRLLKVLDSSAIKLQAETSRLLTFHLTFYFILLEDQVSTQLLIHIKKKLDFQVSKDIYNKAIGIIISLLENDPFSKMSIQCLLREFGNELHEDWSTVLQIFRNLHMVIFLNIFRKGDYSEAGFKNLFKIVKMLCTCKSKIQQRLANEMMKDGISNIIVLQQLMSLKGMETTYGLLYSFFRRLKNGIALLKNQQNRLQQSITLDQQLNMISGLSQLFPILKEDVTKHELILYVDSLSDVLFGCQRDLNRQQVLPLHFILNLYVSFRQQLFSTVNVLNDMIKDKSAIHNRQHLILKTLSNYTEYFKKNPGGKFLEDIETRFAQCVQKLLSLFILRPVSINMPFKYNGKEYGESSANKMALGMYVDQLKELTKTVNIKNLELYEKYIRYLLQPTFHDNLLLNHQNQRFGRHSNREVRECVDALASMGIAPQLTRHIISQVEEADPALVLDYIDRNRDQVELWKRTNLNKNNTNPKKKGKQQDLPGVIREVDVQNLAEKMMPLIKPLIKDVLMGNLYNYKSDLIQCMIIEAIDRHEEEEKRLSNYSSLAQIMMSDLEKTVQKENEKINKFDENRIIVQLSIMKMILEKNASKKRIRAKFLDGTLMSNLLNMINCLEPVKMNENQEKVFELLLNVISLLLPNRKKDSPGVSNEKLSILATILKCAKKVKEIQDVTRQKAIRGLILQNMYKTFDTKSPESQEYGLRILLSLLEDNSFLSSSFFVIDSLLSCDEELFNTNVEAQIKAYFYGKRGSPQISVPKRAFLTFFEKYNKNQRFYKICQKLLKKHRQKGEKKNATNLIFDSSSRFSQSSEGKAFITYEPSSTIKRIIHCLLRGLCEDDRLSGPYIEAIHQILNNYPILIPYVVAYPIKDGILLDQLVKQVHTTTPELNNLLYFLCLNTPLVIKIDNQEKLFSQYVHARILINFSNLLDRQTLSDSSCKMLLALTSLLQLRTFNNRSTYHFNKESANSLQRQLQRLMINNKESKKIPYICEPLSLIFKQQTFENLHGKYKLYEQVRQGSIEQEIIPLQLIFSEGSSEKRQIMEELQRTGEELENEEDDGHAFIMSLERRIANRYTEMFRRRVYERNTNTEFLPIEEENKGEKGQKMEVEEKEQEKALEMKEPEVKVLADVTILPKLRKYEEVPSRELRTVEAVKNFSAFTDADSTYEKKQMKPITYDNQKNQVLRNRIELLASGLRDHKPSQSKMEVEPKVQTVIEHRNRDDIFGEITNIRTFDMGEMPIDMFMGSQRLRPPPFLPGRIARRLLMESVEMEEEQQSDRSDRQVRNLDLMHLPRRRVPQSLFLSSNNNNRERRFFQTLSRAQLLERNERPDRPAIQENEIEKMLEEYVEPPKEQPPKVEPSKVEEKKVEESKVEQPQIREQPVQPSVESPIQPPPIQPLIQPPVLVEPQKVEEPQKPQSIEVARPAETMEVEQPRVQEQKIDMPSPVIPVPSSSMEAETRFRPILDSLGLSQNFLRENGLDEQLFDSLPENVQMEDVLLPIMNQIGAQRSNQPRRQEERKQQFDEEVLNSLPEEERRLVLESMEPRNEANDTWLVLSQIEDPALRQSILIEATPQQLASLPPEIQAQAEMLRTRRLREIAAQFDEEDVSVEVSNLKSKRPKKPAVYPQLSLELFKPVDQSTVKNSLNILFWSFPKNYQSILPQSLLENKRIQPQMISTLLYILRNPLNQDQFPKTISYFKNDKADDDIRPGTAIVQSNIMALFLEIFTNCPYKDNKFLKTKIPYDGLGGIKLTPDRQLGQEEDGYYPYIQLLNFGLDHNIELSAYLLEGVKDLPPLIMKKLVKKLYSSSLENIFIENLAGLSENPEMARIFDEQASETHHPRISIYAHLLKYKFAITKHLQKLHLKALASYKTDYNEFLNQIYRIYTLEDLKEFKQLGQYKSIHRNVIKYLLSKKCKLSQEPIKLIMRLPFLMDFETKKEIFHNQIRILNDHRFMGKLELKLDRKNIFRKSFNQIMARTAKELRAKLCIMFDREDAYDAGGVTRDWYMAISKEMFNSDYALFEKSTSGNTYQPSNKSYVNPDHLNYFKFVGRIVGKALSDRQNIDAFFTRSFYKLILGQELELSDLEEQDFCLHKSMVYYRDNPIIDDLDFTYPYERFGVVEVVELVPNGKNIKVTDQNKHEWIKKMAEAKMKDQIKPQIKSFLQGFHELIPEDSIKFFDAKELQLLISGLPNIDLDDLRANVEYSGYTATDNVIKWFWELLQTYDQEYLAQVIQFITGTSRIPTGGFAQIKGMHGPQKISIVKSYEKNRLPQAHTCYNQLELPDYPTKEILQKNMQVLFKWGNQGFGFM